MPTYRVESHGKDVSLQDIGEAEEIPTSRVLGDEETGMLGERRRKSGPRSHRERKFREKIIGEQREML